MAFLKLRHLLLLLSLPRPGGGEDAGNPFSRGCLQSRLPHHPLRVCNSEDPPDAAGVVCRIPDIDYMEIRIATQNWESVFFGTWILQILFSELLDIPTTVETGTPDAQLNYYDPTSPLDFGVANDFDALARASRILDCRQSASATCAHIIPEVWNSHFIRAREYVKRGEMEPPREMGTLGIEGLHILEFTGRRDPTLFSYLGLQGERNRHKLAETFLTPTTWRDYCEEVSANKCQTPDQVAARKPLDESELNRYHVAGLYTGHFRKTEQNDCEKHPTTCAGHVADYPCGWGSFLAQQLHWNNITLKRGGPGPNGVYAYSQLVELWAAANATKSNLMAMWWYPEVLYPQFLGTDAALHRISLPSPTQACVRSRIDVTKRCMNDTAELVGDPLGACAAEHQPLHMLLSSGLYKAVNDPLVPTAIRSPALEAVKRYSLSGLQLDEIFSLWLEGREPREAVCDWVVDNLEYVKSMIPETYPRVLEEGVNVGPLLYAAFATGLLATVMVLLTACLVYRRWNCRVMQFAQIEFLWLLLVGLVFISVGATVAAIPPSNASCLSVIWLVNIGYGLELIPLLVKVAALNRLLEAAHNHRRLVLKRRSLFGIVAVIMTLIVAFLVSWSTVDPPVRRKEYALDGSDSLSETSAATVTVHYHCNSQSPIWQLSSIGWTFLLLLVAAILVFQGRNMVKEFNESHTLGLMIYSHCIFAILRIVCFFLSTEDISVADANRFQSLIYSMDVIGTVVLHFLPKVLMPEMTPWQWSSERFNIRYRPGSWRRIWQRVQLQHEDEISRMGGSLNGFGSGYTYGAESKDKSNVDMADETRHLRTHCHEEEAQAPEVGHTFGTTAICEETYNLAGTGRRIPAAMTMCDRCGGTDFADYHRNGLL